MAQNVDVRIPDSPAFGRAGVAPVPAARLARQRGPRGLYALAWRTFRRNWAAMVALGLLVTMVVLVLGADAVASVTSQSPTTTSFRNQFLPPFTDGHLLGTDAAGRDVLVRLAYGGRASLLVASLAAGGALVIGGAVGAAAGYFGGIVDAVFMRFVDVLLSLPGLSMLILVSALYRPGPIGLALLLAAIGWAGLARLVRGEVLTLRGREYVHAARVIGASNARIIGRHVLPNVLPVMLVWVSLAIPGVILAEAALSFLGLGVRMPTPSWGNMLDEAKDSYTRSWTNVFIPGFMIYLLVLTISLVGNGLRDALDPRLHD